jgi:Rad3-related DNA helicase
MSETTEKNDVQRIRISVRNLVEFILRSGDIDNRHGGPADKELMQEGSRLHRKIQGKMGSNYRAEVPLAMELVCDGFILSVEGRADGIFLENGQEPLTYIDEIKGSYRDLAYLREPVPVHLAQAMCYAYIYASQHDLPRIGVQMTYCHLETEEIRRFQQIYEMSQLEAWFRELTGQYEKWARYQIEWKQIRQDSIREVTFPFEWRPGQKKVAQDVYRTILRQKKLFIQAPTGTGKTISTVFPAVKAVGEGLADQIFYMTAKTITRTVAQEAFQILKEQGLRMKVLTLTAKEKICFCEETECNPDDCPYARGHFDRVNDAVFEMITSTDSFSREAITAQAEKWQVCPFEFSLDLSLWMDAIICDYNYVFDPQARLKRFFGDGVKGDYLFLIDEAHNLVERGREMFSASLYKEDFLELKKTVKPISSKMARALERCNKYLLAMKRETESTAAGDASGSGTQTYRIWKETGMFSVHLMNLCGVMEAFMEDIRSGHPVRGMDAEAQRYIAQFPGGLGEINRRILDLYFQVRAFLDVCDRLDDNYVIYTEHLSDGRFMLRLYCVDISKNLQECLDRGKSTIFFSATLLPVTYYKSLLSTAQDDYAIYAHSVFEPQNRQVLIGTDTSSRYTNRSAREYQKMARYVLETVRAKCGNYMVFFSSYRMLEEVRDAFSELCEQEQISVRMLTRAEQMKAVQGKAADNSQAEAEQDETAENGQIEAVQMNEKSDGNDTDQIEIISQEPGMNEHEREWFLEQFGGGHRGSLVGFCVMGGIFGEGIDLKNDRLIGAVIVGTGLPQVCNEREILKRFYDDRREDGFFYAYLCPGMNKVLQSAGRVIRTEEDRGVILLLDERFAQERYRRMFPAEWVDIQTCTVSTVCQKTGQFWAKQVDEETTR